MPLMMRIISLLLTDVIKMEETVAFNHHGLGRILQKQTMMPIFECKRLFFYGSIHGSENLLGEWSKLDRK